MRKTTTLLPKAFILLLGVFVLVLSIFLLPVVSNGMIHEFAELRWHRIPFLLSGYAASLLFLAALYFAFLLLRYAERGCAFSEKAVRTLRNIKICAILVSVFLYVAILPIAYAFAEYDDAPGALLIALACTSAPLMVATFVSVLENLLREAVAMKDESELTV